MLNPYDNDAYSMVNLTKAIEKLPVNVGRIRELGIFPEQGVTQRTILVEEQEGVLTLLPTMPVGSAGAYNRVGKRKVRSFVIPHIPLNDEILPSEYEGVRAFGSEEEMETAAGVMLKHMTTAKRKFLGTIEHLSIGALKGVILDADGSVLYNLYSAFDITPKIVHFELDDDTTNVREKCFEVLRHIEDHISDVMTGVRALVSPEFFDALVKHPSVMETFKYTEASADRNGEDVRKNFSYGGITFEEYRVSVPGVDGVTRRFIEEGEGHAFPMGTMNTFELLYAPADFVDTVNTIGRPLYMAQEPKEFNKGIKLHFQSNPLPICYQPGALVRLVAE